MKFNTILLEDVDLPDRMPIRPVEKRQPNFSLLYEYKILFYDVFVSNMCLIFIGPWLKIDDINTAILKIKVDGIFLSEFDVQIFLSKKVVKIIIKNYATQNSKVNFSNKTIYPEYRVDLFDNSRTLYTMQKNNSFEWIKDWISINRTIHSIDNFIIYDNNSTEYEAKDLDLYCSENFTNVKVISCPFLYGPGAFDKSDWDSDYLQYAMFEHVRYSFFHQSGYLLNNDVDEIVPFSSLFDTLIAKDVTGLCFKGYWTYISDDNRSITKDEIKHHHHTLISKAVMCPSKWLVNISKLDDESFLGVHTIDTFNVINVDLYYLHFSGISNDWKYRRKVFEKPSEEFTFHDFSLTSPLCSSKNGTVALKSAR